jgi:hypothetical protein
MQNQSQALQRPTLPTISPNPRIPSKPTHLSVEEIQAERRGEVKAALTIETVMGVFTQEDLDNLPLDTLKDLKLILDAELTLINAKYAAAAAKKYDTGERADTDYFLRLTKARAIKGLHIRVVCTALSKAKERNQRFIQAAKMTLTPEQYNAIWNLVDGGLA